MGINVTFPSESVDVANSVVVNVIPMEERLSASAVGKEFWVRISKLEVLTSVKISPDVDTTRVLGPEPLEEALLMPVDIELEPGLETVWKVEVTKVSLRAAELVSVAVCVPGRVLDPVRVVPDSVFVTVSV